LGKLQSNVAYKATAAPKPSSSLLHGTLTGKDDIPWDNEGYVSVRSFLSCGRRVGLGMGWLSRLV
jgi:hypothetical protein